MTKIRYHYFHDADATKKVCDTQTIRIMSMAVSEKFDNGMSSRTRSNMKILLEHSELYILRLVDEST
jgi:hypothetical protein